MKKLITLALALTIVGACAVKKTDSNYCFDGKPSAEVLDNYLDRAIVPTPNVPGGMNLVQTIKDLWNE